MIGSKNNDLRGSFLALISLIIRNKRTYLGTLSCQRGVAEVEFSTGEHFGEDAPCLVGYEGLCGAAPGYP